MADQTVERVAALVQKGERVLQTHRPSPPNMFGYPTLDSGAFNEWRAQSLALLSNLGGSGHVYIESFREATSKGNYISAAKSGVGILRGVLEDVQAGALQTSYSGAFNREPLLLLDQICSRFHLVARQLRSRHAGRSTLSVTDEYDVQDLLHSLLWLHFEDIRPEEYTPSYAGKASRLDFLLKIEQIVVETKKTRPSLHAAALGGELIEDIARYQKHPDCKALVCFVYDPEGFIANPRGVENDLSRDEPIPVRVLIRPK